MLQAADGELAAARGDDVLAGAQLDQIAAGGQAGEGGLQFVRSSPLAPSSRTSCLKVARACGSREMWSSRAASVICSILCNAPLHASVRQAC